MRAVLFAVEAGVRITDATTCTQEKNKWLLPSHVREIPYLPVSEIDFTSAKKKHELMVKPWDPNYQDTCSNLRRAETFFVFLQVFLSLQ